VGGLDVSVAYRPAAGLAAGGDFFDVFALSDACTGIIVGDVSGHGRESLVQAALARYTLRTLMGEGHPLGEVLTRADRYLAAELEDAFVTVVVAVYDRDTHELRWAKAGHEAPIIAGEPDSHEEPATPLGLGMGETWPEFTHVLQPQQRACLFTDGLVEGRRDGAMVGLERLRTLVEQGLDAQEIVDAVAAGGTDRRDDVAAVVLGRGASPPIIRPGGDHAANTHQRTV
jgi:serine phosphatase RsbU (regulator of sigma subunit)